VLYGRLYSYLHGYLYDYLYDYLYGRVLCHPRESVGHNAGMLRKPGNDVPQRPGMLRSSNKAIRQRGGILWCRRRQGIAACAGVWRRTCAQGVGQLAGAARADRGLT